jgi:hypothetical protein
LVKPARLFFGQCERLSNRSQLGNAFCRSRSISLSSRRGCRLCQCRAISSLVATQTRLSFATRSRNCTNAAAGRAARRVARRPQTRLLDSRQPLAASIRCESWRGRGRRRALVPARHRPVPASGTGSARARECPRDRAPDRDRGDLHALNFLALPPFFVILAALVADAAGGAAWAAIAAIIRLKRGVQEVLCTLNFVGVLLVAEALHGDMGEPGAGFPQSSLFEAAAWLPAPTLLSSRRRSPSNSGRFRLKSGSRKLEERDIESQLVLVKRDREAFTGAAALQLDGNQQKRRSIAALVFRLLGPTKKPDSAKQRFAPPSAIISDLSVQGRSAAARAAAPRASRATGVGARAGSNICWRLVHTRSVKCVSNLVSPAITDPCL